MTGIFGKMLGGPIRFSPLGFPRILKDAIVTRPRFYSSNTSGKRLACRNASSLADLSARLLSNANLRNGTAKLYFELNSNWTVRHLSARWNL